MPGNVDGYPKYDNSLYIYAYNQIMGNSSGATGSKSCSLQDCPHPSDISTGLCKLGLNYLWTFLLNCIADFRDWAEDVTQTVLGEARDAILPDVSSMVEDFSPQLDFGALGKDELGMAMLAVAAEALDFLVPELGGEVQTIGDQIMDFQLDGTLFQFDKEEETADHLRTKMSQAIDSIITKIENSASILLEKTPVNTEANPYSQQPMNAIDLFQNGAYAAPKSWSSQVAPAKQRTEKVLAASIIGNIWKTQEVFVATATKQLTVKNGDTEKTNPKALCDYDTSGSEITSYCKDGRVYWLLQADALNHAWQKFKKPSGIDKLSSYANLQSSEIMTSVVTRYEKNLKDSLSAANAWSFMDADKDADRPLYIPLKVLDLDQIDKTIYVTTPSTVQESYKDIVGDIPQTSYWIN
ncbi:uncharacterized protein N7459_008190 [Penicillium hispanicum]|uniref:uncharacterized protein n=1 Tax=Penicillium hispanicum TaxID=1080232 RepID=UPI002540208A|nr:uncharacterized protein N7459_008190 [Penicillium hispanicum]KAJ5573763.1 hypothetical protein N7459_008190 [Penicillium hispanicum]